MTNKNFLLEKNTEKLFYLEDFDADEKKDSTEIIKEDLNEIKEIFFRQEDLLKARKEGFLEAYKSALTSYEDKIFSYEKEKKEKFLQILNSTEKSISDALEKTTIQIVDSIINHAIAFFPINMEKYGIYERNILLKKMNKILEEVSVIKIITCKDGFNEINHFMKNRNKSNIEMFVDESFLPGDFEISWSSGKIFRNSKAISETLVGDIFSNLDPIDQESLP